jgi:glutaredoxin
MSAMPKSKLILIAALLLSSGSAFAQYKFVGADGSVTYSDRPPPSDARVGSTSKVGVAGAGVAQGLDDLPFALKQVSSKYPVVLYSAPDCAPCTNAKVHLAKRGVPYSEKQIRNAADATAFKSLGFSEMSFPAISIGAQKQNGFEATALDTLLDAAGYPKSAKLPASYQAKSEPLTAEPSAKTTVRVADAGSTAGNEPRPEAKPKRPAPAPVKQEPSIRF